MKYILFIAAIVLFGCSKDKVTPESNSIVGDWLNMRNDTYARFTNNRFILSNTREGLSINTGIPYTVESNILTIDGSSYGAGSERYQIVELDKDGLILRSTREVFGDRDNDTDYYRRILD